MNVGVSYSANTDRINNLLQNQQNQDLYINADPYGSKPFSIVADGSLAQIKAVFERRLYGLSAFRFGGEYLLYRDRTDFSNQFISNVVTTVDDDFKAGFAEADLYINNDLAAKIGGRLNNHPCLTKPMLFRGFPWPTRLETKRRPHSLMASFTRSPKRIIFYGTIFSTICCIPVQLTI